MLIVGSNEVRRQWRIDLLVHITRDFEPFKEAVGTSQHES